MTNGEPTESGHTKEEKRMDCDEQTAQRLVNNLLYVCRYSGQWNEGIRKVMLENRNLMKELYKRPDTRSRFIWIEDIVMQHDIFFESLLAALRPTFPTIDEELELTGLMRMTPWPGRNYGLGEVMWTKEWLANRGDEKLCGIYSSVMDDCTSLKSCFGRILLVCLFSLDVRLDENRKIMETILVHPDCMAVWVQSWLEKIDIFFLDVFQAIDLERMYQKYPDKKYGFRDWPCSDAEYIRWLVRERSQQYTIQPKKINMGDYFRGNGFIP